MTGTASPTVDQQIMQLKAQAYDIVAQVEFFRNQLEAINNQIARLSQARQDEYLRKTGEFKEGQKSVDAPLESPAADEAEKKVDAPPGTV